MMSVQKYIQAFASKGVESPSDRLPVAVQLSRNRTNGEPPCVDFTCYDAPGSWIHVQRLL